MKREKVADLRKRAFAHVRHQNDRQYDLVGRRAEQKRHENHAVQPEAACKGIEKGGTVGEQTDVSDGQVRHEPDDKPRGRGDRGGAAEHEQRAINDGTDNDLTDLRLAIGREFKRELGSNALQNGRGEQA